MQNLFSAWTLENKKAVASVSPHLETYASQWGAQEYPRGEYWKYVDFSVLRDKKFQFIPLTLTEEQTGQFYLKRAAAPRALDSELVHKLSQMRSNKNKDPFVEAALSFEANSFCLKVKKENMKAIEIHLDADENLGEGNFIPINLFIDCDEGVKASIILDFKNKSDKFILLNNSFHLAKSSEIEVSSLDHGHEQGLSYWIMGAELKESSHLNWLDFTCGQQWSRHNLQVILKEKEAQAQLFGAYIGAGEQFVDHHTEIQHAVGDTFSFEDYRGLLAGKARAVFNGKIHIEKRASGANSQLLNKNLLLSEKAEVDTKPELQIDNDNVKAAHGATVGRIDEEQLFYLQSRGFSEQLARKTLAQAFLYSLLDGASVERKNFFSPVLETVLAQMGEL